MKIRLISALTLALIISLVLCACGDTSPSESSASAAPPQTTAATTEPVSEYAVIDAFILQYDGIAPAPLADVVQMDIQGEDYQTEFRLPAFDNAVGKKAYSGDDLIQIVNYGVRNNDSIRFYGFFGSYDAATQFVYDVVHILDSEIPDDEIADQFSGFEYTGSVNVYLGKAGYISGYLNTSYANGGVSGYSVFIDCSDVSGLFK